MMRSVLEYLEASASHRPESIAVVDESGDHSYRELLEASRSAGSSLASEGIEGRPVMIVGEKGFSLLAAMFGVLFAGGYYVPVDPGMPADRMRSIFACLREPLVIADCDSASSCGEKLPESRVLLLESLFSDVANDELLEPIRSRRVDANPAYVLFTSGSTGTPKGVVVSHRAIISFIDSFVETFAFTDADRVANQAPFDFDVSVKDIYGSLASGATLVIIPRRLFSAPAALADFLETQRVTVMTWAVSALCLMTTLHALDGHDFSSVRAVLFSGEVMPLRHLRQWMDSLPQAEFVNLYGPTEITCNCTYHVVERSRTYPGQIPLGIPFPNREVLLLSDDGTLATKPGEVGEICVRGSSLASGYVGMPPSASAAFTQNPCNPLFVDPIYRTGDYAAISEDGELFFRGRRDNQIKYQGHRIELEEIDRAAERVAGVSMCRSVFDADHERLFGFYVGDVDRHELAATMRETLPRFMVPSRLVRVDSMPLTKNGKADKKALLALASSARHGSKDGDRHDR